MHVPHLYCHLVHFSSHQNHCEKKIEVKIIIGHNGNIFFFGILHLNYISKLNFFILLILITLLIIGHNVNRFDFIFASYIWSIIENCFFVNFYHWSFSKRHHISIFEHWNSFIFDNNNIKFLSNPEILLEFVFWLLRLNTNEGQCVV